MDEFIGVQVVVRAGGETMLAYIEAVRYDTIVVSRPTGEMLMIEWRDLLGATGFRR